MLFIICFKSVLFNAQFDQNENSEYVTQMINYLNTNVAFSADAFYQSIQKMMVEKTEVNVVKSVVEESPKRKKEIPSGVGGISFSLQSCRHEFGKNAIT